MKRLGIIGGVSWHSSLQYYRLINEGIAQRLGRKHSAQLVISSLDFADLLMWQKNPDENVLKQAFLAEGERLQVAGCDGFIIASHTLSWLGDYIQKQLGLEHVRLYNALFGALTLLGVRSVGLTGTRYTMGEPVYRSKYTEAGFRVQVPDEPYFTGVASIV